MKKGIKFDDGKLQWGLLPIQPTQEVIKVLMYGAKKYSPDNWMYIEDIPGRYYEAALRHLTQWKLGEKVDSETGKSHLAHAACCLLFILWRELNPKKNARK